MFRAHAWSWRTGAEFSYMHVQKPAVSAKTPMWGQGLEGGGGPKEKGPDQKSEPKAGPKGWRGIGEFQVECSSSKMSDSNS